MSKYKPSKNSARAPALFQEAAIILKKLSHGGSFNSLIFRNWLRDPQGLTALVTKASQYRSLIDRVIDSLRLLDLEPNLDIWLVRILIAHLCFGGKQRISGASPAVKAVLKYRNEIQEAVVREDKYGLRALQQVKVGKPRYVRVNTLKITTEEFIKILKDEGFGELACPDTYDKFLQLVEDTMIEKKSNEIFMRDFHVKDMLVFPRDTFFQHHPAYREGKIVLQDKASCLQSCCVKPPPGSVVLDMCSAPGMKTSLYAAMIQNTGKIYAIERSEFRFHDMQNILETLGATCVTTINNDAGVIGPETCANVEYIVVDPSCSGSGMSGRAKLEDLELQFHPQHQQTPSPDQRIQKLQNLQTYLLKHALSNFPQARCIVYSTCSKDALENEAVVEKCLNCARLNGFGVVDLSVRLKGWRHFGHPSFRCGPRTVYTKEADLMNGGFFAVFEKEEMERKVKKEEEVKKEEGEEEMTVQDLVIQLAVKLLNPSPGNTVLSLTNASCIQATTTLIQEKMQDVGKVYVLNGKKLEENREKFVGKSVEVKRLAALESSDANCRGVNRVLVFPESSGSAPATSSLSPKDLHQKFAAYQFSLLRHAFTAFPQAKRIVYATTSTHPAENEEIIDALQVVAKFHGFNQVDAVARVGGNWRNNRPSIYHCGEKSLMMQENSGKGLFVAVFERDDDVEGLDSDQVSKSTDGIEEFPSRLNQSKDVPMTVPDHDSKQVSNFTDVAVFERDDHKEGLDSDQVSKFNDGIEEFPSQLDQSEDVPMSVPDQDSNQVSNVTDVAKKIASQLEFSNALKSLKCLGPKVLDISGHNVFLNQSEDVPMSVPDDDSNQVSNFTDVSKEIPSQLEFSKALKSVGSKVLDKSGHNVFLNQSEDVPMSVPDDNSNQVSNVTDVAKEFPSQMEFSNALKSLKCIGSKVLNKSRQSEDVPMSVPDNDSKQVSDVTDVAKEYPSQLEFSNALKSLKCVGSKVLDKSRQSEDAPMSVPNDDSNQVSNFTDVTKEFPSQLEFSNALKSLKSVGSKVLGKSGQSEDVPMSVPEDDSIQVSNVTDVAEKIASQLEFSNALKSLECVGSKVLDKSRQSEDVPMSVPNDDSNQVSNVTDVAEKIASQLEFSNALKSLQWVGSKVLDKSGHNVFLNQSEDVPMSVPKDDSNQVSNVTDVAKEFPSQLEFSNALKSLKCVGTKALDKSGHNVSAIGKLFFIDTDGNTCAEQGSPDEIVEVKNCDGSVTEKRRRQRQREKRKKWRKLERRRKERELIALNMKENTEAAGSLQQQTSSINPASPNVGNATEDIVDGAELFVEKQRKKNKWTRERELIALNMKENTEAAGSLQQQTSSINPACSKVGNATKDIVDGGELIVEKQRKKNKWTRERKRLAKEAREAKAAKKAQQAKAAKKMQPPISSSKVGNCQTDMVSLGSEFFVIDRQGRMEDGGGGNKVGLDGMENLERRNGVEERRIGVKEMMEDGAKGNGEGGNKGGLDGMENLKRRGDEGRKLVAKEEMEDGAKGNGDDCEEGNKGGMENLKRRNFYKKRKRFSAKLVKEENIVNAKMYRERKRKKKNKRQTLIDRQGKIEDSAKRNGDDCEGGKTKENGMKNLKRRNVNEYYGNKGTKKMMEPKVYKTRAMSDWEWFVKSVQRK